MIVTAIRRDPGWQDGRYTDPPLEWLRTMPVFTLMTGDPARMQERAPTADTAAWSYDVSVYSARQYDANDVLYWFEASRGYYPEAALGTSKRRSSLSISPTTKPIPWRSASCSA